MRVNLLRFEIEIVHFGGNRGQFLQLLCFTMIGLVLSLAGSAAAEGVKCKLKSVSILEGNSDGLLRYRDYPIEFRLADDGRTAIVRDPYTEAAFGGTSPASVKRKSNGAYHVKWSVLAQPQNQPVQALYNFSADVNASRSRVTVRLGSTSFDDAVNHIGSGPCTPF